MTWLWLMTYDMMTMFLLPQTIWHDGDLLITYNIWHDDLDLDMIPWHDMNMFMIWHDYDMTCINLNYDLWHVMFYDLWKHVYRLWAYDMIMFMNLMTCDMTWRWHDVIWTVWYVYDYDMTCYDLCFDRYDMMTWLMPCYDMTYVSSIYVYVLWYDMSMFMIWHVYDYDMSMIWYVLCFMFMNLWHDMFYVMEEPATWHILSRTWHDSIMLWYDMTWLLFFMTWHDLDMICFMF
jgi:hypothetical protein